MRFCQALMSELYRHLGSNTDVPAGDIGVGAREVGFMAGAMKAVERHRRRVHRQGHRVRGSLMRPEATGYGTVYFAQDAAPRPSQLRRPAGLDLGSGNVAQYAAEKAIELGARVITFSDSDGTVVDRDGIDTEKLQALMAEERQARTPVGVCGSVRPALRGRQAALARAHRHRALPCATQNELDELDAATLVANGACAAEGANMPCTLQAVDVFPPGPHVVRTWQGQQRRRRGHPQGWRCRRTHCVCGPPARSTSGCATAKDIHNNLRSPRHAL